MGKNRKLKYTAVPIPEEVRRDLAGGATCEVMSKQFSYGAVHVMLVARPHELATEAHASQLWEEQAQALELFVDKMRETESSIGGRRS